MIRKKEMLATENMTIHTDFKAWLMKNIRSLINLRKHKGDKDNT